MVGLIQTFFSGAQSGQGVAEFHFRSTQLTSQNSIVRRGSQACLNDRQFLCRYSAAAS